MGDDEIEQDIIKRHSEYANWGEILKQCVDRHGVTVKAGKVKTFYHGIDKKMLFPSTIAYFHGPLSTSSEYDAAMNFANQKGDGLIIVLRNLWDSNATYFDCAWLSDFASEAEKFFIGGDEGLMIKNIIAPLAGIGENYEIYVESLNVIQHMMRGMLYQSSDLPLFRRKRRKSLKQSTKYVKRCVVKLLQHEMHRHRPDEYVEYKHLPGYISDSLHYFCQNVTEIRLDWRTLHLTKQIRLERGYTFCSYLLIRADASFLDLQLLCMLFPRLEKLTVDNLNLCTESMEAISSYCQQRLALDEPRHVVAVADGKEQTNEQADKPEMKEEETAEKRNNALTEISIYRPTKPDAPEYKDYEQSGDEDGDGDGDGGATKSGDPKQDRIRKPKDIKPIEIDTAVQQYADVLKKYQWSVQKKARFELTITKT